MSLVNKGTSSLVRYASFKRYFYYVFDYQRYIRIRVNEEESRIASINEKYESDYQEIQQNIRTIALNNKWELHVIKL